MTLGVGLPPPCSWNGGCIFEPGTPQEAIQWAWIIGVALFMVSLVLFFAWMDHRREKKRDTSPPPDNLRGGKADTEN